jgi:hypothetical protein
VFFINSSLHNARSELKSNNPKILRKMNYLRNLFVYFENVLHPASGWSDGNADKRKRKGRRSGSLQASPECFNIRGGNVMKKQDKQRRNPAP